MNKNMDLVNSITANSNNKNESMENQAGGDNSDSNGDGLKNKPANLTAAAGKENVKIPDYLKAIGMDPRKFWPKKYRFTREKPPGQYNPLSIAQRNFYENNGYIILDDAISGKLLNSIKTEYNQSSYVNEFLMDKLVAKNTKLLQYVKCFCDERMMLMTSNLVESFQSKEAIKSFMDNRQIQRQQLFRDWVYLPFRPMDKVVCTLIAIEPIEQTFLVVPGTHRIGQCNVSSTLENITAAYESSHDRSSSAIAKEIFECAPENLSSLVEKSRKGPKYISIKPGQTLFYHPGLIHGFSDDLVNYNKRQLAAIAYYAAADCEYVDLRKSIESLSNQPVPITLGHFKDKNPSDYSSWIDKPKLLRDVKASL